MGVIRNIFEISICVNNFYVDSIFFHYKNHLKIMKSNKFFNHFNRQIENVSSIQTLYESKFKKLNKRFKNTEEETIKR